MNSLLIGLLSAAVATNQAAEVSNVVKKATGIAIQITDPKDPVERELKQLMEDDDETHDMVDRWMSENRAFGAKGAGLSDEALNQKIQDKLDGIRKRYEKFIQKHPNHARGLTAYGSFLNETGDEVGAVVQWEKAKKKDPSLAGVWNNLANYFGHRGPVTNAFAHYEKAIALDPTQSVYFQNMATTVFLFRMDAKEYYQINEQQVFDKALELYQKALKLAPNDLPLATDVAQTYYGIKPLRTEAAISAWNYALKLAESRDETEGILIHLARVNFTADRFDQARKHLSEVNGKLYQELKTRLAKSIDRKEAEQAAKKEKPETAETKN